jgi:hypothetical protein
VNAAGRAVAYTYGDDRSQGVASQALTVDEALRIAVGIAKLPELRAPNRAGG